MRISNTTLLIALLFAGAANCERLDPASFFARVARDRDAMTVAWSTLELLERDVRTSAIAD